MNKRCCFVTTWSFFFNWHHNDYQAGLPWTSSCTGQLRAGVRYPFPFHLPQPTGSRTRGSSWHGRTCWTQLYIPWLLSKQSNSLHALENLSLFPQSFTLFFGYFLHHCNYTENMHKCVLILIRGLEWHSG